MEKNIAKKTVKINENDLVDLIDNIVNEAVAGKKKEWLAEQAAKAEANGGSVKRGRPAKMKTDGSEVAA